MLSELRLAFRTLGRSPAFTLTAIGVLALGIGANTAIFSLVNQVLLNPPGVADPARVVAVRARYDKLALKSIALSVPDFADVRGGKALFSHAAITRQGDFNYTAGGLPERLQGAAVSVDWFEVFGAKPLLGRVFRPEEDAPNANLVAVLAYATWQRLFGGDPGILAKTVELNQKLYRVVGVMDAGFRRPRQVDLWVPLGLAPGDYAESNRFNESYFAVARLRPGFSAVQANAFIGVLADRLRNSGTQGAAYARDSAWGMFAVPLAEFVAGDTRQPLLILLGAVGFVLLIACSNIAGLMLARASVRTRDLAVRAALGAGRWQLLRQTFFESLVLAVAGAAAGLVLAAAGMRALLLLAPGGAASGLTARLDVPVLLFTAAAAVAAGLFFAVAPAWQISRIDVHAALKGGGRSGTAGPGRLWLRSALVVCETALALLLVAGAGLFLRSLARLQQVSPGFEPRGVATAAFSLPQARYDTPEKRAAFYRSLEDRLAGLPGATASSFGMPLPFSDSAGSASFAIEGRPSGPGDPGPHGDVRYISPGYFETMRIPLRAGRWFTPQDRQGTASVVVIDENLARQYWPGANPLGKHMRRGGAPWSTVVGVVGHVRHSDLAGDTGKGTYYYSVFQQPIPYGSVVVRTRADPAALAGAIRQAVRDVDPNQPVHHVQAMEDMVAASLAPRRFAVVLLGFFAAVALAMAALGLFGVVGYSVAQRTREIGIRMALGAGRRAVLVLVLGQGLRLAGTGVALGLAAALAGGRALRSQLFAIEPWDPATMAGTAAVLIAASLAAAYIPARRAAKVDPLEALRWE